MSKYVAWAFVVVFTIAGLFLVAPFFSAGFPMNIDLPLHYARLACIEDSSFLFSNSWCAWLNSGSVYFHFYSPFPFLLSVLFAKIVSLELAFKLALVLLYFLSCFGGFYFFYRLNMPLAGAFAYGFLLLEHGGWHNGGFEQAFLVGMVANAFGSGFFLYALADAIVFFQRPSHKALAVAGLTAALLFVSHPVPFVAYSLSLVVLGIWYFRNTLSNWKLILLLPLIVFLLSGFYSLPYIVRHAQGYYASAFQPISIDWAFVKPFFLDPLSKPLMVLGVVGAVVLAFKLPLLLAFPGVILLVWGLSVISPKLAIVGYLANIQRFSALLREFLFLFAAYLFYFVSRFKAGIRLFFPVLVVVLFLSFGLFANTKELSKGIFTSEHNDVKYLAQLYPKLGSGRVLHQETLNRVGSSPLSFSHGENLGVVLYNVDTLDYNDNSFHEHRGVMGVEDLMRGFNSSQEIMDYFRELNVQYVVLSTADMKQKFSFLNVSFEHAPWTVYKTEVPNSYFSADCRILSEKFEGDSASVVLEKPCNVTFKVHDYPNWLVEGGKKVSVPGSFIKVKADSTKLEFSYSSVLLDYLAWLFTLAGIVLCVVIYRYQ